MKKVTLNICVLRIDYTDGDVYTYLYANRDAAIENLYERAKENWSDTFDDSEDEIDDYTKEGAVDHYYSYVDESYAIEMETVEFPLIELQDRIAMAIELATNG